ncbi:hypothetical protein SAMN05192574_103567 [Mucilaginibacter gossypiicola]|uniref:Uncharacterized protein n=1 Tax=Mucilaginibacter gossypiicola TaxID=551995 RepID=A0A1H8HMW8_9SPHI|nr:hypothetical protein [Mucilaginibacter gossypiicola]SEN57464.1 hypothetical protein SAMN05192574_103567 [Mucilaginibacter gossypiicola]
MKIFRQKNRTSKTGESSSDKAAGWLASGIHKIQSKWASGMDKLYNRLSARRRKVILIAGCIAMTLYSTAVIAFSFSKIPVLIAKPVSLISPLVIPKPPASKPSGIPDYVRRIERFRSYLDSLSHTMDGRKIRDSILHNRPGLIDSIQRIEDIFCKK